MRRPAVLLDTNLFVLLVVGRVAPALVGVHKRLRAYDSAANTLLGNVLTGFDVLVSTPNILTETSNLLGRSDDEFGLRCTAMLRYLIESAVEIPVPSRSAAAIPAFSWLGLADAATIEALKDDTLLLTDDEPLFVAALRANRRAELFSTLR